MSTPTGTISLSDVNKELGYSISRTINMGDSEVRNLAGVSSTGMISMSNLKDKSSTFVKTITIASDLSGTIDLYSLAVSNGYDSNSDADITYDFTVSQTGAGGSGGTFGGVGGSGGNAITTGSSWPTGKIIDITIIIESGVVITGGGGGGGAADGAPGGTGGSGIYCTMNCTITNNGTIRGGGGGGGAAVMVSPYKVGAGGGGGGAPNGRGGTGSEGSLTTGATGQSGTTSGGGLGGGGAGDGGTFGTAGGGGYGNNGGGGGYSIRYNGHTITYSGTGTLIGTHG